MKKHLISTPVKPRIKLRQVLVHPKEKLQPEKKYDVIYEIQCLSCNKTYMGETGRIREAVEIKKRAQGTVNRDEGAYMLSHTWDADLHRTDGRRKIAEIGFAEMNSVRIITGISTTQSHSENVKYRLLASTL